MPRRSSTSTSGKVISMTPGITNRHPQESSPDQSHHLEYNNSSQRNTARKNHPSRQPLSAFKNRLNPRKPRTNGGEKRKTLFPAENRIPYIPTIIELLNASPTYPRSRNEPYRA